MNNEPFNANPAPNPDPGPTSNPVTPVVPPAQPVSEPVGFQPDVITSPSQPVVNAPPAITSQLAASGPMVGGNDFNPPAPVAPAPAAPINGKPFEYSSNPFRASAKGLGLALTVNPISSLFIGLFSVLIILGGILVGGLLSLLLPGASKAAGILLVLVAAIVALFRMFAAITQIYDKSMIGQTIGTWEAFGPASKKGFFRFVGTTILMVIFTLLAAILLIIPGIVVGSRIAMAPFIVYAENLGALAAIKRSWRLSRGHTWEMISAIFASYIVVGSSGGLLSTIGIQSGTANRYYELKQAEDSGVSTGKMHWLNVFLPLVSVLLIAAYFGVVGYGLSRSFHEIDGSNTSSSSNSPFTSSGKDYCYYPSDASPIDPVTCVTKSKCQAVSDCAKLYFNGSSSDSTTDTIDNSGFPSGSSIN